MSKKYGKIKNSKVKQQWLKDLRSGNYKQCTGNLCQMGNKNVKSRYCCLGILGRSLQKLGVECKIVNEELVYKNDREIGMLPEALRKEIGISISGQGKLIQMNDEDGLSFNKIADFIEENL